MTYKEAREYIDNSNQNGGKLGLTAITELLKRLDDPQDKLKVIHVAGTNGKGSTTAYISTILATEGYRVGRYNSPAVFDYLEQIKINSDSITEQRVCDIIEVIKSECDAMVQAGFDHPTPFEIETAMAYLYFAWEQVDYAVIEVGLGGRLDATNVISHPLCCVITSISMDHMLYLGDTLEQITWEKAGIIKMDAPVVTSNTKPEVLSVLKQICSDIGTSLQVATCNVTNVRYSPEGTQFSYDGQEFELSLLGKHQIANAILAINTILVIRQLGCQCSDLSIKKGLLLTRWHGRLEILATKPYFILDGAHNEDAAIQLKNALLQIFPTRRFLFIMGVLADKEYEKILKITAPLASVIITITPKNSRALDSSVLANEARLYTEGEVIDAVTVSRAINYAYEYAQEEDVILAFGSLSYLGEIRELRKEQLTFE